MSIVKVIRLTPVCQQAFDVAHIWVNLNIKSRSNQAKHPLMSNKTRKSQVLDVGTSETLLNMSDSSKDLVLELTWI